MIRYKLTDQDMQTYNNTQWVIGESKSTNGKGDLCGPGWLHCYSHPLLAVLLNPIHAAYVQPRLFKCNATGNHKFEFGLKEGSTTMELIKEIPLPIITLEQKIAFGILNTLKVYNNPDFQNWGKNWLNNIDRSNTTAWAAAWAARAAARAARAAAEAARAAEAKIKLNLISIAKEAMKY